MQDVELIAQAGALMAGSPRRQVTAGLRGGVAIGWLSDGDKAALEAAYRLCWQVQAVARLLTEKPLAPDVVGDGGAAMLQRETGIEGFEALAEEMQARCDAARDVIEAALERVPEEGS